MHVLKSRGHSSGHGTWRLHVGITVPEWQAEVWPCVPQAPCSCRGTCVMCALSQCSHLVPDSCAPTPCSSALPPSQLTCPLPRGSSPSHPTLQCKPLGPQLWLGPWKEPGVWDKRKGLWVPKRGSMRPWLVLSVGAVPGSAREDTSPPLGAGDTGFGLLRTARCFRLPWLVRGRFCGRA